MIATLFAAAVDEAAAGGGGSRFVYTTFAALMQGSIYALVALGFVLVFKATQAVNFAQGAIALVTAWFFTMVLADWRIPGRWVDLGRWGDWLLALLVAGVLAAVLGLVIERLVIRPMIGEPLFAIAVITLGLEAIFRTIGTDAVSIYNRALRPPWGTFSSFKVAGATIYWSWIATIVITVVVFAAVLWFFRTRYGIAMRAVAFDQEVAMAQGISVGRVFAAAWAATAVLAMIAAIAFEVSPPTGRGTVTVATIGLALRALPAVILGGLDSVHGALAGGLAIGFAEIFAGSYLSQFTSALGVGYSIVVPYVVMLIVLIVRPYGLFGTPEIRRV